jgi:hypothetical protein
MSDEIDFSNEGLAERVVGVEPEPEVTPGVEDEPVEDKPELEAEGESPVEESPAEDPAAEPVDGPQPDVETPNEWQVRYDEAQKVIGRQGQELGELRKMVEQIQQQANQPAQEPQPQSFGVDHALTNQILDAAATPEQASDAFYYAAQNAPGLIPDVLAEIQAHDPGLAKRFEIELYQAMIQSTVAPVQDHYSKSQAEQEAENVVATYGQQVADWADIKDEVAKIIEEEPDLVGSGSAQEIERGLRWATRMARQAREAQAQHVAAKDAVERAQQRQAAVVETGTPAAAPVVEEVSEHDAIRNAILESDKRRRAAH